MLDLVEFTRKLLRELKLSAASPVASILLNASHTPDRMIRRLCALMLVVLAASPFTAPFSTCDLGTLFGSGRAPLAFIGTAALAVAANPANVDANSISPVLVRTELRRERTAATIAVPDHRKTLRRAGAPHRSRDLVRPPHDPSQQITVLRL